MTHDRPRYADQQYWERRYETEDHKEWLCDYRSVSEYIRKTIKPSDQILVIGCGNSTFSFDLFQDGYRNITNIDYASSVIKGMKDKYPMLKWLRMDMRKLEFEPKSFPVIIEKATLDALLDGERDPWNVSEEGKSKLGRVLSEISRVLTDDGVFISISFAQPHFRLPFYVNIQYNWSPGVEAVGTHFHHYIYTMIKGKLIDQEHIKKYLSVGSPNQYSCLNLVAIEDDESFLSKISVNE